MKKNQSRNLTAILDAMEDGIYIVNSRYTIEYMNKAMIRDFGEGTGKKCHEVMGKSVNLCRWCTGREVFDKGKTIHTELYIPTSDKTYAIIELPIRHADGAISKLSFLRDITQTKEREIKLKETEEDYKRLFEHVGSGIYISSKEGKFLNVNKALIEMLGYETKQELLEIDLSRDLYVMPDDRVKFQKLIEKEGRVIDYEVDFKRKDKTTIPVQLTSHVRYDQMGNIVGYEGITVNLSDRKKMEKKVKETGNFLTNIIQNSPNAVMASDLKGKIILWNRGAEQILGYRSEDVVGKLDISEVYPPGMYHRVMGMMRSTAYGNPGELRYFPVLFKRKGGENIEGSLSASLIHDDNGNEMASVSILVDVSERLSMERKLHRIQEQLLQSEKLAAMGRLISQIAHELNNPLYGIMNTLELMKTEIPPENRRRKLLDMSLSETVRLADMLKKMLSFSKPDQEERALVDINVLLDEILLLYEKMLFENTIRLLKTYSKDLCLVNATKNQLRQVFINMISNAADAMPDGGSLSVTTVCEPDQVRIIFSDTGVGIKKENIHRIFDAFYTTKDSVKGVGLGLSVCYGFILDHGGDIIVESEPGHGATFTIILPRHKID